jgi:Mn2+/Fe2+ NRAMP family transporter
LGAAIVLLGILIFVSKLQWIERIFGLTGLLMSVFALSAWFLRPDWTRLAWGFVPQAPPQNLSWALYAYFAAGIFSAMLMEYEVHFYSSGAIEEDWGKENLGENVAVSTLGSSLGAVLTVALVVLGALVFLPRAIFPDALSTTLMPANLPFGPRTLQLALAGVLACVTGAAIETALSGAYNICQFYNLPWGKNKKVRDVPQFTWIWILMLGVAGTIALTGVRPLLLVDLSIVLSMIVMPFTYYPILRVAGNRAMMGRHANGRLYQIIGYAFFVVVVACAVASIPLTIITKFGKP